MAHTRPSSSTTEQTPLLLQSAACDETHTRDSTSCYNDEHTKTPATGTSLPHDPLQQSLQHQHPHQHGVVSRHLEQLSVYSTIVLCYFGVATSLFVANGLGVQHRNFLPFHLVEFLGALAFAVAEALLFYSNPQLLTAASTPTKPDTTAAQSNPTHYWPTSLLPSSESLITSDTAAASLDEAEEEEEHQEDWQVQGEQDGESNNNNENSNTSWSETITLCLVSCNVVSAAIAATLFVMDPHGFEEAAHYIEYGSQITVTMVDFVFIVRAQGSSKQWQLILANLLLIVSIVKFFLYLGWIPTRMGPEQSSHYVEFLGEMLNSAWAYLFAMQQYRALRQRQERYARVLSAAATTTTRGTVKCGRGQSPCQALGMELV